MKVSCDVKQVNSYKAVGQYLNSVGVQNNKSYIHVMSCGSAGGNILY